MPYKELGLKCGLEIHQQLEGKKLFCNCPTQLRDDKPHFTIHRKLRASAGESGEIDIAAEQEQRKGRSFAYEGYADTTCLVEADEEPPHELNKEALYTALQLALLANASISSVIQVMRKTIVDGSATSGFQRTGLIARNGKIHLPAGEIRIDNINIEEDSCKNIAETGEERIFRLDRLGIPLIEIGTAPDITTPEECQETAKKIGMLLRSLPGVKRGLGTIRQDVNVSIRGGERIEIKGAQDLKLLPLLVDLEVKRQKELLAIREQLKGKQLALPEIRDLTSIFAKSTSKIIEKTIRNKGKMLGIKLTSLAGVLGRELQPNYRVGSELAGRARIRAGVGGIFHSDELPNYGITDEEIKTVRRLLLCQQQDAFVLVADREEKANAALHAVYERASELWKGVPKEVRKANADGTTSFMRPLSGSARMYPETDVPLIKPELKLVCLPEILEEKIIRYQKTFGLSKDLAEFIAKSDYMILFEEITEAYPKIKPAFVADVFSSTLLEIKRKYALDTNQLTDNDFRVVFKHLAENKIHKDIMLDVLIDMCKGTFSISRYASLGTEQIHAILVDIVKKNPQAPFSALMGLAMKALAGKASGQFISEELKKIVDKGHA